MVVCFGFGLWVTRHSKHFVQNVDQASKSPSRDPAAIKKVYDFSGLDGSALDLASKQRLLSGAEVVKSDADVGIKFGHFVFKGTDGQKIFACQKYSKMVLEFEGDGSISGDSKPSMEVEGNCSFSADINSISPLLIPISKILGEPVGDGEFDFREGHQMKIRFANVMDEWPTLWRLKGIKLYDQENPNQEVKINDQELKQLVDKPLVLNFR